MAIGIAILIGADLVLAFADTILMTVLGAALLGLQMGVTQGLLAAAVADAAPERLRGTAFGIFDMAVGVTTFAASAGAGVLWLIAGPAATFIAGAVLAAAGIAVVMVRTAPGSQAPG